MINLVTYLIIEMFINITYCNSNKKTINGLWINEEDVSSSIFISINTKDTKCRVI